LEITRFCFRRWLHPKGADSMAISGLHFGDTFVGSELATAVLLYMHKWVEKTVLLPVWASGCRLSAVTIASGCGLSHERVEDGCKQGIRTEALEWNHSIHYSYPNT